jgi:hypothetical protein
MPLAYALLAVVFWREGCGRREALAWAALVFGALVFGLTEALNRIGSLTGSGAALAWAAVCAVLLLVLWRRRQVPVERAPLRLEGPEWVLLAAMGGLLAVVTLIALAAPPNTYDSQTYHMARVAHWAQNASVDFYATAIPRQLYQHPLAEYAILHTWLLTGGDGFANLAQVAAYALGMSSVSLVARELGASRRAQLVSALLFATLPMAVLQASSTQNDLITALWVALFVWLGLRGIRGGLTIRLALGLGVALGLALATKGTVYIYVLPFALWLGIAAVLRQSLRAVGYGAMILVVGLVFLLPHAARNTAAFGTFLGPEGPWYINRVISPAALISNVSRNLALELSPPEPMDSALGVTATLNRGLAALHGWLGLDVSDPDTTWVDGIMRPPGIHEDMLGASLFVLLLLVCAVVYIARRRRLATRTRTIYALTLLASFLLFALILRYMPWHNRLHLPMLALAAPWVALVVMGGFARPLRIAVLAVLFLGAIPPLVGNVTRPLIGPQSVLTTDRWTQYFSYRPVIQAGYDAAFEQIGDCRQVGLWLTSGSTEYPFWARAADLGLDIRFEHVPLTTDPTFTPCIVFADIEWLEESALAGFTRVSEVFPVAVYRPSGP